MKRFLMLVVVLNTIGWVYGQNESKHYFGAHYLIGSCDYHSSSFGIGSSKEYNGTNYFGLGFDYRFWGSEKTELCFGITATVNKMILTSSHSWQQQTPWGSGGGTNTSYYDEGFVIFSLPIHFKHHFFKYFFIGGGPCLNIHQSMGYKWGLGLEVNAGVEYVFKSGLTVSVTPRGQWNWLNFLGEVDTFGNGSMDILSQKGINIGLGYRFGKLYSSAL